MASSDRDATVGMIMMPITKPATSALKILGPSPTGQMSRKKGVMPLRAKNP